MADAITISELSDEEQTKEATAAMQLDTPEVRSAAAQEAARRKQQMINLNIVATDYLVKQEDGSYAFDEDKVDDKVIQICRDKEAETGKPAASFATNQQWYIEDLIRFAAMTKLQRYQWGKKQTFFEVASVDDMAAVL